MKAITFFFALSLALFSSNTLTAQVETSPDETAIRQIVQDMQDGWNTKSGEKFAAHFAADHSYVVWNGMYLPHANPALNARVHQGLFNGVYKIMDLNMKVDNVRFVKPDVAMVHTLLNTKEGEAKAPDYPQLLITMLMVKNGNNWEIVSFHNLNIEYDQILHKPEPTEEEIMAFAKENYPEWYR